MQTHRHVGVEEAARIVAIGADPAHLGRQMKHHVRSRFLEQPCHRDRVGQVVLGAARDDHLGGAALLQQPADGSPEEARAAGHQHALARQAEMRSRRGGSVSLRGHRAEYTPTPPILRSSKRSGEHGVKVGRALPGSREVH